MQLAVLVLMALAPRLLPVVSTPTVDARVIAVVVIAALAALVIAGLAPAWRATRVDPADALRGGGRDAGGTRAQGRPRAAHVPWHRAMRWSEAATMNLCWIELKQATCGIAARPAFSALVIGVLTAGPTCVIFMLAMINGLLRRPLPFAAPEQLLHTGVRSVSGDDNINTVSTIDLIERRRYLANTAEVSGVARSTINLSDQDQPQRVNGAFVSTNLFHVLGIALLLGRDFPASMNTKTYARTADFGPPLWLRFDLDGTVLALALGAAVLTALASGLLQPTLLIPLRQGLFRIASIAVRTRGDALAFAPRLDEIMRAIDPDTPVYWSRDYAAVIRSVSFGERIVAQSFGIFGVIALVLAGAGLYGVMAFGVGQRMREIGVRRALGASNPSVLRNLFGRSFLQLGIGLAIGMAGGIPFAHLLSESLHSIPASDAAVVSSALGILILAAMLAVTIPARRALRVDPMLALRHD